MKTITLVHINCQDQDLNLATNEYENRGSAYTVYVALDDLANKDPKQAIGWLMVQWDAHTWATQGINIVMEIAGTLTTLPHQLQISFHKIRVEVMGNIDFSN
jgi:hypothetical protein